MKIIIIIVCLAKRKRNMLGIFELFKELKLYHALVHFIMSYSLTL